MASCFVPLESTLGSSLQDSTDSRPQLVANISCESSPAHGAHKSCEITNDPSAEVLPS
ncbi:unnamed protein product [Protopolystoma xenopodis]|uniref:Uncharacterized protein n=1 Tax=Protopolystoma xenopodis TaxID=117903 RepID=A0A448XRC6_9PLAT|nr:unnamed protein product [Protopolystoma xenopodis]